jgi:hypothetical protein
MKLQAQNKTLRVATAKFQVMEIKHLLQRQAPKLQQQLTQHRQ